MEGLSTAGLLAAFFPVSSGYNPGYSKYTSPPVKKNILLSFSPVLFLSCRVYPAILEKKRY